MTAMSSEALDLVRLRAAAGLAPSNPQQLTPRTRRSLAVAEAVGAPMLPALDAAAAAEDDIRITRRAIAVASAQTKAVAGGLLAAPLLLVPFLGNILDVDLVAFYGSVVGRIVGLVGLALLGAGAFGVTRLVRRVGAPPAPPPSPQARLVRAVVIAVLLGVALHWVAGLVLGVVVWRRAGTVETAAAPGTDEAADLTAVALTGGVAPGQALRVAAPHLADHAAELRGLALELELGLTPSTDGALTRLGTVLRAATDVGAPAAPALRRLAGELRADERARVLAAAERLPAQLTFPTALALLPATLLLIGAPIVHVGLQHVMP